MKKCEQAVYDFLCSLRLGSVVYEPDGNIPPDFLVGSRIAVEARLLNYNYFDKEGGQGLAETSIPLEKVVRDVLIEFGPPRLGGPSWFVSYIFWRPRPKKADVVRALRSYLSSFLAGQHGGASYRILQNLQVGLHKASKSHPTMFLLGSYVDRDANGFVVPIMQRNLQYCSETKQVKVADYKSRYSEWWLVLVDRINMGFDEGITVDHDWDKLIVIDSGRPTKWYEVLRAK